jgi:hypothetical protein
MRCPICEAKLMDYDEQYMGDLLTEAMGSCIDDLHYYRYLYSMGSYEEVIGNVTFTQHHSDSDMDKMLLLMQKKGVIDLEADSYKNKKGMASHD